MDLLNRVAAFLNDERCQDRRLVVAGHADYFGGRLYNEALSIRRAQAVIDALAEAGLSPSRAIIRAFGEAQPEDPERTPDARARNRRVVLTVIKQGDAQ
jgi:outer membrane protein OmpA-like peptidoglycan-associated protein